MSLHGSCHCGNVTFTVEGTPEKVFECNCSYCSRKGWLIWMVPRSMLNIKSGADGLETYLFNKREREHKFCPTCGVPPFSFAEFNGIPMAAVNARCLTDFDWTSLPRETVDGKSF